MEQKGKIFFFSSCVSFFVAIITSFIMGGIFVAVVLTNSEAILAKLEHTNSTSAVSDQANFDPQLSEEALVVSTVERVKPAVVSIVASADVPVFEQYYEDSGSPFGGFDPFGGLQMPQYRQKGTEKQDISSGSGFIVSEDGYIVTNKHVVDTAEADYTVFTNDGQKYPATVVAKDPANDIAVLKIDAQNLTHLEFADSDQLHDGQTVIAIGNALGEFSNTVSVGVVSGLSRSIVAGDGYGTAEELEGVIQTDAAINLGNSGGPLLNSKGEVIGMNVAAAVGGAENIAFALPANLVKAVVTSVQETGKIIRPQLGVRYVEITPEFQKKNQLAYDYGVLVYSSDPQELAVIPGSPAAKAGIQPNDIILEADGQKLDDDHSLINIIRQKNVGDVLTLKIVQSGTEKTITVTLEAMPE